mmetsp:Transcript_11541/g.17638  ORF Transcript_11541/g.17638 Transcript_11541/m.17638 type:complete len:153 (-) Transcript_11541:98-556(-)
MRASSLLSTFSKSTARLRLDWFSPVEDEVVRSSTVRLDANSAAVRSSSVSRTHMRSFSWRSLDARDGGGLVLSLLANDGDISSDFGTVAIHGDAWRNGNCWFLGGLVNSAVRVGCVENAAMLAVHAEKNINRRNIIEKFVLFAKYYSKERQH